MKYETVTEGAEYIVTVCVDEEYLKNAVYPVYVDPTISYTNTYIADATIYSGYADSNFGSYSYLVTGYYDASYGVGRTLVRFPGVTAALDSMETFQIINADFFLYKTSGSTSQNVSAYAFTGSSWSESTVTWNNASASSYSTLIDTISFNSSTEAYFDVTSAVRGWIDETYNETKGLILVNSNENDNAYMKSFYSRNYSTSSYRPYLVVDYAPIWTSVGGASYPDVGKTIDPEDDYGSSYFVYLYAGSYVFESCQANADPLSYSTTITVYNSAGSSQGNATSTGVASLTLNSLSAGYYRVKVEDGTGSETCFVRVKTSSGGASYTTHTFAYMLKNYKYIRSEYSGGLENCVEYALDDNNLDDPEEPLHLDIDGVQTFMTGEGYGTATTTQPYNGVITYFDSSGECTHFAKIVNGVVSAMLGHTSLADMIPVVYHDSPNAYYSDSYGTEIYYFVHN